MNEPTNVERIIAVNALCVIVFKLEIESKGCFSFSDNMPLMF